MESFRSCTDRVALLAIFDLFILIQFICSAQGLYDYKITVESSNYTRYDSKYLGDYKLTLWADKNGNNVLAFEFESLETIQRLNAQLNFDILRKDNSRIHLMNFNSDVCKFIEGDYGINALKGIHRQLMSVGNLPRKCPVAPMKYYIRNFTVRSTDFSPVVPEMNWNFLIAFKMGDVPLIDITFVGNVKKTS